MKQQENIIQITLPMPPSINSAYANSVKGRHKTKAAKEWEEDCYRSNIKRYIYTPEKGKAMSATYKFYSKWINKGNKEITKKDLSNYFKLLEDILTEFIKGFDDQYIWEYNNVQKVHSDREEVEIELKEINI